MLELLLLTYRVGTRVAHFISSLSLISSRIRVLASFVSQPGVSQMTFQALAISNFGAL
jgi:hypothetical protein